LSSTLPKTKEKESTGRAERWIFRSDEMLRWKKKSGLGLREDPKRERETKGEMVGVDGQKGSSRLVSSPSL